MTTYNSIDIANSSGTIAVHDPKALRMREAILAALRAFEDMYDLPRSIPTRAERLKDLPGDKGHHNRG